MKRYLAVLALLLTYTLAADNEPYNGPSEEDVIVLDADTLEPTIYQSQDPWLLELYAPWCDHCKTLRPEWAKLATKLKGEVKVAKIDASIHRKFDKVYDLKGYPHIVFIPSGAKDIKVYYKHQGARTASSIEEWTYQKIKQNKGFLVERLTSPQVWKSNCIDLNTPICVIALLPNSLDSSPEQRAVYLEILKGTVNNFRDKPLSFVWAQAGDHPEFQAQFNMKFGFPSVILINPMRQVFSIMKSSFTQEHFEEWLTDILNRKGGRKFGKYSKELEFSDVPEETPPEPVEIHDQEFAEEL